jgi:hypothetical protein
MAAEVVQYKQAGMKTTIWGQSKNLSSFTRQVPRCDRSFVPLPPLFLPFPLTFSKCSASLLVVPFEVVTKLDVADCGVVEENFVFV